MHQTIPPISWVASRPTHGVRRHLHIPRSRPHVSEARASHLGLDQIELCRPSCPIIVMGRHLKAHPAPRGRCLSNLSLGEVLRLPRIGGGFGKGMDQMIDERPQRVRHAARRGKDHMDAAIGRVPVG